MNSVLNQTYQDFEVILIYDDENKNDLKFIESLVNKNPKVKIIENTKNLGAGLSEISALKFLWFNYCF